MTVIADLDHDDDTALRAFWEVEQAAQRADRSHPVLDTFERRAQTVRQPAPGRVRLLLAAYDGPELVGTAELVGSTRDNRHLGELEVNVLPSHRRRGIGRALHDEAARRGRADGRTTYVGEACQSGPDLPSGAVAFALALGFESAHREDHLVLDLPAPPEALADRTDGGPAVLTWTNHAPEEVVAAYARMRTQMNRDVPTGDVDLEPRTVTVADVREEEERLSQQYDVLVGVAGHPDGTLDGYTLAFLPRGEDFVQQDDTFVMRQARGRGIGRSLKTALLRKLAAEHPDRTLVHTWTAVDNGPMQRLNRGVGFRPVELTHEMQRHDASGA